MSPGSARSIQVGPSAVDEAAVRELMSEVAAGHLTVDEAVKRWKEEISDASSGKNYHPAPGVFVGLFFMFGGGLFAVIGFMMSWQSLQYSLEAKEAPGVVVELQEHHSKKGSVSWHPVVRYVVDGKEFKHVGAGGSSWFRFSVGDSVGVLYKPADPREAQLNTFAQRWLMPLLASTMGTLFASIGGALAWSSWQEWRRRKTMNVTIAGP